MYIWTWKIFIRRNGKLEPVLRIYRLDLTPDELKKFKDKLDVELLIKFKKIEISEKKIDSMKKASSVKIVL